MSEPAFPSILPGSMLEHPGMTLRDWFAGQALIAFYSTRRMLDLLEEGAAEAGMGFQHAMAKSAYAMADAMLAERENSQ